MTRKTLAINGHAATVFNQQNGDVTKTYYVEMNKLSSHGQLAVALFRAQKRSSAAKKYRGGGFRRDAYDVKNWSLSEICRVLTTYSLQYVWGWKIDPLTPGYDQVLYVDLPQGQVSFHSEVRLAGPDYSGDWDNVKDASAERICMFCDYVEQLGTEVVA